jgi:D-3-phosphoglycerate dehydrogenase / 2-oxoglutarate reductase
MPHVLVVGPLRPEGRELLERQPGLTFDILEQPTASSIMAAMPETDAIVLRTAPITAAMIEAAPQLKVISRHGVGYDNVDMAAMNARRIPMALAVSSNRVAVAEHAFLMLLELLKHGRAFDRAVRADDWGSRFRLIPLELAGRTLLIVGFGRIGREVAERCAAFGMAVMVHDPYVQANVIEAAGDYRSIPDWEAALPETDVLTVHLPLGPDSRGLIGSEELKALPRHAFVINAARGGIVDEAALHAALTSGAIAGAGLDVFDQEPPPPDHPLFTLDNVVLSPHNAGLSKEAAIRMAISTARNALAGIDGKLDPSMVVNREVL